MIRMKKQKDLFAAVRDDMLLLVSTTKEEKMKQRLEKLADKFKPKDQIHYELVKAVEAAIEEKVNELNDTVALENEERTNQLCDEITALLENETKKKMEASIRKQEKLEEKEKKKTGRS